MRIPNVMNYHVSIFSVGNNVFPGALDFQLLEFVFEVFHDGRRVGGGMDQDHS